MRRFLITLVFSFAVILNAQAWGQKGHDIIAYIAECHLTDDARAEVDRLFAGYSMVYWSNWADSAKYIDEYKHTSPWHYRNVEENSTPELTPTPKEGDVVWAIEEMISRLKDSSLLDAEHTVALKFLVHFVGDLHCPMHAGRRVDLGGNRVPMVFFYNSTNLHSIWDTAIIEKTHNWSHTEWAEQIDRLSLDEESQVVDGAPNDWFSQTYDVAVEIYKDAKRSQEESYNYCTKYQIPLETQLRNGGLRLASILNKIYTK